MSYNRNYTVTTLSASLSEYDIRFALTRPPIIPPGRIRQPDCVGIPYTVTNGPSKKFPFGAICQGGCWVCGKIGAYALKFNGINQHVELGNPIRGGTSPITHNNSETDYSWMHGHGDTATFKWSVSFWMRYEELPVYEANVVDALQIILCNSNFDTSEGITIAYDDRKTAPGGNHGTKSLYMKIYSDNYPNQAIVDLRPGNVIGLDTEWHHIVITYDHGLANTNAIMYIDGVIPTNGTANKSANAATGGAQVKPMSMGSLDRSAGYQWFYSGILDDMAIWRVVLTQEEVKKIYNGGIGIPADNIQVDSLVSYWNFEEGPGVHTNGEDFTILNSPKAISGSQSGSLKGSLLQGMLHWNNDPDNYYPDIFSEHCSDPVYKWRK